MMDASIVQVTALPDSDSSISQTGTLRINALPPFIVGLSIAGPLLCPLVESLQAAALWSRFVRHGPLRRLCNARWPEANGDEGHEALRCTGWRDLMKHRYCASKSPRCTHQD